MKFSRHHQEKRKLKKGEKIGIKVTGGSRGVSGDELMRMKPPGAKGRNGHFRKPRKESGGKMKQGNEEQCSRRSCDAASGSSGSACGESSEVPDADLLSFLDQWGESKWYDVWAFFRSTSRKEKKEFKDRDAAVDFVKKEGERWYRILRSYMERAQHKVDKERRWLNDVILKGTFRDKVASRTLLIQQCPVLYLDELQWLIQQMGKVNRSGSLLSGEAVKDLMLHDLIPKTRKLYFVSDHPFFMSSLMAHETTGSRESFTWQKAPKCSLPKGSLRDVRGGVQMEYHLVDSLMLFFEDQLKSYYISFILALQKGCTDSQDFLRHRCTKIVFELLAHGPEQEQSLLALLVSRLLNTRQRHKDSMLAGYFLHQLLKQHRKMVGVVSQCILESLRCILWGKDPSSWELPHVYVGVNFLCRLGPKLENKDHVENIVKGFIALLSELLKSSSGSLVVSHGGRKVGRLRRKEKKSSGPLKKQANSGARDSLGSSFSSPSYKLLRVVLDGLCQLLPKASETVLAGLCISQETLNKLFHALQSSHGAASAEVSVLSFWFRLNKLFGQDQGVFYQTFFKALGEVGLVQASNRLVLVELLQSIEEDEHKTSLLSLSLGRRCLQTVCCTHEILLQLRITDFLFSLIRKQFIQTAPCLLLTEKQIKLENEEDPMTGKEDVKQVGEETFDKIPGSSALCGTVKKGLGIQAPRESGSDPYSSWSRDHHIWEVSLLQASVHPGVAHYSQALYGWALECRERGDEWGRMKEKPSQHMTLDALLPSRLLDKRASPHGSLYLMSGAFVLESLAHRNLSGTREKGDPKPSTEILSPHYWKNKSHVYPHEHFLYKYFTDPIVVERFRHRQAMEKRRVSPDDLFMKDVEDQEENSEDEFFTQLMREQVGEDEMSDETLRDAGSSDIASLEGVSMESLEDGDAQEFDALDLDSFHEPCGYSKSREKRFPNVFAESSDFQEYLK